MPDIKIKVRTVCGGKVVEAGEVVDATARDAKILIDMGMAE